MDNRVLNSITGGRYWKVKSLLVVTVASFLFSCAPAIILFRPLPLPPAYQLKSEHPFADTSLLQVPLDPGERSHGAKLTPRVLSSVFLFAASKLSLHPYLPATAGGMLYLLCGIVVGFRVTEDRIAALFIGLSLAGLYAANACFAMNFVPKPFDGIALGMVAITMMMIDRPWLFAAAAYLSCWTDERAILSLGLIALVVIVMKQFDAPQKRRRCGVLAAAVFAYFVTRSFVAQAFQWSPSDMSMLGENLLGSFTFSQLAAWACFEGGWIAIASAIWMGWKNDAINESLLIAVAAVLSIGSCLVVLDISRAGAFTFPLILVAFASLAKESPRTKTEARRPKGSAAKKSGNGTNTVRISAALSAVVSLIATNFEIIAWTMVQPLPTTPIEILTKWMNV